MPSRDKRTSAFVTRATRASARIASRALALIAAATVALSLGCSDAESSPEVTGVVPDGLPSACNPLRSAGACLLPFPSSAFVEADASTATGQRLALTQDVFPENVYGTGYDPARMNGADGFSPSAEILAYFPERLDPASLPSIDDPAASLSPASATVVVDMETGELVAHFSEVDAQVFRDEDRQALILRPSYRLAMARRYAVAVTDSIRTLDGKLPTAPPAWDAVREGTATDPRAAGQAARMPAIFAALEKVGVARAHVLLAWDFTTGTEASITRTMRSMREQTLAAIGPSGLGYAITSVEDDFSTHALKRVRGTFAAPRFLTETDVSIAETSLTFDAAGAPVQSGTYDVPFTVILPRKAASGPVKLLLFGHGFLGSGEGELGGDSGSYLQSFADKYGYALIATDWSGLSEYEGTDPTGSGAAGLAVQEMNRVPWISDRLQQAMVDAMTLARTAREQIAKDPALFVDGAQVIDDTRIDYFGISLGGVLGSVLVPLSPDLERGVLNVGAASWSTLFQRSLNWSLFKLFVDGSYPDKLDQQVLLEVMQAHFDAVDGMSYASHVLGDTLDGGEKHVLLQMAVNDTQVPNIATEMAARTMGLPLLDDAPIAIYGMTPSSGPLPSALTVWDAHAEAPPKTNKSATVTSTNSVHNDTRALPAVMEQIDAFLRTGEVVSTCEGTCDPQ